MTDAVDTYSERFVSNLNQIRATKLPFPAGHIHRMRHLSGMWPEHAPAGAQNIGKGQSVGAEQ
ncbi:MAG: hypothetical protein OXC60_15150 [Litoreibacter sp.]|nr:hypothetical protein [Litoreibacter sp.]MCY4335994.1 hypothetical protein [Litoreibacter sp.]